MTALFSFQDCSSIVVSAVNDKITPTNSMTKGEGLPNCYVEEMEETARDHRYLAQLFFDACHGCSVHFSVLAL